MTKRNIATSPTVDRLETQPLQNQPALYVAARIQTFFKPDYESALARVRREFPESSLLEARLMFASNEEWRAAWPAVLARISGLVLIVARDGLLGGGCVKEIRDAKMRRLRCYLATPRCIFRKFRVYEVKPGVYKAVVDPAELWILAKGELSYLGKGTRQRAGCKAAL